MKPLPRHSIAAGFPPSALRGAIRLDLLALEPWFTGSMVAMEYYLYFGDVISRVVRSRAGMGTFVAMMLCCAGCSGNSSGTGYNIT